MRYRNYYVCARNATDGAGYGPRGLLEIYPACSGFDKNDFTVVAEAESRQEAFEAVRVLVEEFISDHPDCDFTKFAEWSLK